MGKRLRAPMALLGFLAFLAALGPVHAALDLDIFHEVRSEFPDATLTEIAAFIKAANGEDRELDASIEAEAETIAPILASLHLTELLPVLTKNGIKTRQDLLLLDSLRADAVVEAIQQSANTGKIGDGKIFVQELVSAVRIRTGESGSEAL